MRSTLVLRLRPTYIDDRLTLLTVLHSDELIVLLLFVLENV